MAISCVFCDRTFSNVGGKAGHVPYCKLNPDRVQRAKSPNAHASKGKEPWNKGQTKETDPRIEAAGIALSQSTKGRAGHSHSDDTKAKLSLVAKSRNLGGYEKGSGRGKSGWYKGIYCDSSWELAYVVYCLDHGIDIKRSQERREYAYKGKTKIYIPDFLVEGSLVEIKGYCSEQWLAKLATSPDVKVYYEKDLAFVFNYIKRKYGKDWIRLYENKIGKVAESG